MLVHIITVICLFWSAGTSSIAGYQDRTYEEKAVQILSEASKKLQSYESVHMEFTFSSSASELSIFNDSDGFLYVKGNKYYIKTGDIHFISDGTLVWIFFEDVNEVHISYAEDTEQTLSPVSILKNFKDDYKSLWIRNESFNNRAAHIIDMVPDEPQAFGKYRLGIDTETSMILFTTAFDRQGETYTYTITNTNFNPDVSDDFFVFYPDRHPGIEIVDLR